MKREAAETPERKQAEAARKSENQKKRMAGMTPQERKAKNVKRMQNFATKLLEQNDAVRVDQRKRLLLGKRL